MTDSATLTTLISWLSEITGADLDNPANDGPNTVIFYRAEQDQTRPQGQYGTVRAIRHKQHSPPQLEYEQETDDTLIATVTAHEEVTFSVDVYRDGETYTALDIVERIRLHFKLPSATEYFGANGMGFVRTSSVRSLYETRESKREPRAEMDITFNVNPTINEVVDRIKSVDITGDFYHGDEHAITNTKTTERNP